MKKVEEKYLLVDDYMLRKVLEKIKEILGIEKYDDINILIDTRWIVRRFYCKNVVILITCVVKDNGKFCAQIFLEETLLLACKISSIDTF